MPLKNSMIGELPNIKITSTADITDTTVQSEASINNLEIESSPNISRSIHPGTGEAADHRALQHLDYENSGHTGFAASKDLRAAITINAATGAIDPDSLQILKSNFAAKVELDGNLLSLSCRARDKWTYTSAINDATGNMVVLRINPETGAYTSSVVNPAQQELNAHINDSSVHLQAGERNTWNNKVSAEVIVEEEKLSFY